MMAKLKQKRGTRTAKGKVKFEQRGGIIIDAGQLDESYTHPTE